MSDYSHNVGRIAGYKAEDPIYQTQEYNIDLKANHIYLFGEDTYAHHEIDGAEPGVEFVMANRFIKNLNILMRKSDDPILIHMKTCGGMWEEGMAIYDAIKACPNHITILSYTHARSMSSIILQAAEKRVLMPHSTFMFHGGTIGLDGTHKQFMTEADEAKKVHNQMMKIYIDSMKAKGKLKSRSRKYIYDWLQNLMDKKEDVYFSAEDAVKYGFADEVFGADGVYDWQRLVNHED
jgi:ATP-dependent protease ClpP protease subunit